MEQIEPLDAQLADASRRRGPTLDERGGALRGADRRGGGGDRRRARAGAQRARRARAARSMPSSSPSTTTLRQALRRHRHRPPGRRLVRRLPPEPLGGGGRPHQEAPARGARALRGVRPPPRSLSGRRGPLVRRAVDPDRVGGVPQPVGRLPARRARAACSRWSRSRSASRGCCTAWPVPPLALAVVMIARSRPAARCSAAGSASRSACSSTSCSTARGPTPTRSGGRSSASTGRRSELPELGRGAFNVVLELVGAATCWWLYRRFRLDEPERRADFLRTGRVGRDIVPG